MSRSIAYDQALEDRHNRAVELSTTVTVNSHGSFTHSGGAALRILGDVSSRLAARIGEYQDLPAAEKLTDPDYIAAKVHLGRIARDVALTELRASVFTPRPALLLGKAKESAERSLAWFQSLDEAPEAYEGDISAEKAATLTTMGRVALVVGSPNVALSLFTSAREALADNPDFTYYNVSNEVHAARANWIAGNKLAAVKCGAKAIRIAMSAQDPNDKKAAFNTALRVLSTTAPYSRERAKRYVGKVRAHPLDELRSKPAHQTRYFIDV